MAPSPLLSPHEPLGVAWDKVRRTLNTTEPNTVFDFIAAQWRNPQDILSLLQLIGPSVIHAAIAQLAGRSLNPVALSFGWVTYAFAALFETCVNGKLMPPTDNPNVLVIGTKSGHSRTNESWVLGRLFRDLNDKHDAEMTAESTHEPPRSIRHIHKPKPIQPGRSEQEWEALRLDVYDIDDNPPCNHGRPIIDTVWLSGWSVMAVQMIISTIPWILDNRWGVFLITASGTFLAILSASLPQWRNEKWASTNKGTSTVVLTRGNGTRHAIVILDSRKEKVGLDLEVLSRGTRTTRTTWITKFASVILTLLWIGHLLTMCGLEQDSWYILVIGILGNLQNLYAAAAPRSPSAHGIHLKSRSAIKGRRVASVLREAEEKFPGTGASLINVFFPGSMRVKDDDLEFWNKIKAIREATNDYGTPVSF